MELQNIVFNSGGALLVLMTIIQIAPIKVNPWSWVASKIGHAFNSDLEKRLNEIEHNLDGRIGSLENKLHDRVIITERRVADEHRKNILNFNSSLLRGIKHTREEYIEILSEIDIYETYCRDNPDYPNNRAVLAIENIKDNYRCRLKQHDFLQESNHPAEEEKEAE